MAPPSVFDLARLARLALLSSVALLGCGSNGPASTAAPQAASTPSAPAAAPALDPSAEAKQIFATRCTPCHGPEGRGDGPASKGLTPPPRDFGDAAWQQATTDDHLEKIIQYGGAAVSKSPAMPANPDLTSKPEVVKALTAHLRTLKR